MKYAVKCDFFADITSHILPNTANVRAQTLTHTPRLKWCYHMLVIQTHSLE